MTSSSRINKTNAPEFEGPEIVLHTFEESKKLILRCIGMSRDTIYKYTTLEVEVAGKKVRASGNFLISEPQIREFAGNLLVEASSVLDDENGGGSISVSTKDDLGHFLIRTNVGNIEEDQAIVGFETDQTAISSLKNDINRMIVDVF